MKGQKWIKGTAAALAAAGVLTLLAALGLLERIDLAASDAWYQQPEPSDGEIVLVEIDQRAIDELGPFSQWSREVIAEVLEKLNASPDCHPAVIALDIIYTGGSSPEADQRLADAAGRYGNVITGSAAVFGEALAQDESGEYFLQQNAVLSYEGPYDALEAVSDTGHINAMLDNDGVLRHHMLSIRLPDGTEVPSLALAAAEKYRAWQGLPPPALPETSNRGFWYLPFCGRTGDFDESISVADVLSGDVEADFFADRIVLIGPYATGLQDQYIPAIDRIHPMYGVEFQANAIQALLWEDYKLEADRTIQLVVLFLVLLGAFAGFWRQRMAISTLLWVALCGGWLAVCRIFYDRGVVLHVLWIPAGVTVLYISCIAVNYIQSALEKRRVTNTFKRYVAPEIVSELLKEDPAALKLGGRLTNIAVLFVDVRGFTPMSELLDPEQVVEILNRYLTLISDSILRNGGTLDKFVGDAAMAFWGAPLPQKDHIMRAVQAAADMVSGSQALSEELMARYGRTVSFGIGIHVGEAVVGNIGSPQRMDYTAIGDTVNTAARLEANAPGGTVYISRAVADALEGRIRTTSLGGSVKLKGKKEGFEVLILEEILPEGPAAALPQV